jgi:high-affinity iron transporter
MHTPLEALELLSTANPDSSQTDLVDATAYLWIADADSAALNAAETLYNKNCAACHGQTGGGDGPASGDTTNQPAAFSDPSIMFERRGDVFYAKIRRGGMGTDMPNFGTVFTPEETWTLVDYVWSLAFPPRAEGSP